MQRTLFLSRHVVFHMLPLGRSLPCRLVATVILALLTAAAMAGPNAGTPAASATSCTSVDR